MRPGLRWVAVCWPLVGGVVLLPVLLGMLASMPPPMDTVAVQAGPGWPSDGGPDGSYFSPVSGPGALCASWSHAGVRSLPSAVQFPATATSDGDLLFVDVVKMAPHLQTGVGIVIVQAFLR
jgi:hypothetical protein